MLSIVIPSIDPCSQKPSITTTIESALKLGEFEIDYEIVLVTSSPLYDSAKSLYNAYNINLCVETNPNHSCALNDGIVASSGSHILILNPGDCILSDALETLKKLGLRNNLIYFFNVISDHHLVGFTGKSSYSGQIVDFVHKIGIKNYLSMPHQGLIAPKSLSLTSNIWYKQKYNIRMDYDFLANIARNASQYEVQYCPLSLAYYPPGGEVNVKKK